MTKTLNDARVLVTGGTSGIGRALVERLLGEGARVMTCGTDEARVGEVQSLGAFAVRCDLCEPEDQRALALAVDTTLGGLDVLVHCAAIQRAVELADGADPDALEREIAIDLVAPLRLDAMLLPRLLESPDPSLVHVTSVLALAPKASAPAYCAAKAGLSSWSAALRAQLEGRVHVMELMPPLVATRMTEGRSEGAIPPEVVAGACVEGLRRGTATVRVGKARAAHALHRIAPSVLARKLRAS